MKVLKHKNILGLIYGVLLMIPFLSVLSRSVYVSMNKNAKDSWSGQNQVNINYKYQTNDVNGLSDIVIGNIYHLDIDYNDIVYFNNGFTFFIEPVKIYQFFLPVLDNTALDEVYTQGGIVNPYGEIDFSFYDANRDAHIYLYYPSIDAYTSTYIEYPISSEFHFEFDCLFSNFYYNDSDINNVNTFLDDTVSKCVNLPIESVDITQNTLDNAFEYSLSEITNNDIGKVKFFTWFADMFLDVNNGKSAVYVGFINWYFNYSLLVSLGFVLYAVLMWFINWIRRLLEKGQDFGQGGF